MDYGKLLGRAWNIIWEHKFLILLGVLVALGGANGGGNASANASLPQGDVAGLDFDFRLPDLGEDLGLPVGLVTVGAIALIGIALIVGIALWALSTIARGGLVAGVSAIDAGSTSSFGQAFRAGWQKGWALVGIGILPAIPGFILLILGAAGAVSYLGLARLDAGNAPLPPNAALVGGVAVLACLLVPIAVVLSLLRTFANRACMLEDLGVFASYRRGVEVLLENVGPALVLFLLQIAIGVGLAIALLLPQILMALCCVLWPVLLLVQGAMASYFSTLWTLAWREWTSGVVAEDFGSLQSGVSEAEAA